MESGVSSDVSNNEVTSVLHSPPERVDGGEPLLGGGELKEGVAAEDEVVLESHASRQLDPEGETGGWRGLSFAAPSFLQNQPENPFRNLTIAFSPNLARSFICLDLSTMKVSVKCPKTSRPAQSPVQRPEPKSKRVLGW